MLLKKILLPILVVLIFIAIIVFGSRGLQDKQTIQQPTGNGAGFTFGEPVDWTNPEKPHQSLGLEENEIPKQAVRLNVSVDGFAPNIFEVKKGKEIVLSLTSIDEWTHLLVFENNDLSDVFIETAPNQTKVITFYAPEQAGEYEFFCYVPGHKTRGERGKMIVK